MARDRPSPYGGIGANSFRCTARDRPSPYGGIGANCRTNHSAETCPPREHPLIHRSAGACPPRSLRRNEKRPQPRGHGRLLLRPRHGEGQALALRWQENFGMARDRPSPSGGTGANSFRACRLAVKTQIILPLPSPRLHLRVASCRFPHRPL